MSRPDAKELPVLVCKRCGFEMPLAVKLPAWCPLCDEDNPSQLRVRQEESPAKKVEEAA